jgi:RNA polymerase sigma-70 factor (ECF subfamily)
VQDAFLACWRQAQGFEARRGNARAWLLAIVHHRAVDLLRSARQRYEMAGAEEHLATAPSDLSVEQETLRRLDRARIRSALACLPAEQRQIVILAYFEGYRYPEIAELLHLPLGTVKSRLRLALAHMNRVLHGERGREQDSAGRSGEDRIVSGEDRIVSLPAARLAMKRRDRATKMPAPSGRPNYAAI